MAAFTFVMVQCRGSDAVLQEAIRQVGATIAARCEPGELVAGGEDENRLEAPAAAAALAPPLVPVLGNTAGEGEASSSSTSDANGEGRSTPRVSKAEAAYAARPWQRGRKPADTTPAAKRGRPRRSEAVAVAEKPAAAPKRRGRPPKSAPTIAPPSPATRRSPLTPSEGGSVKERAIAYLEANGSPQKKSDVMRAIGASLGSVTVFGKPPFTCPGRGLVSLLDPNSPTPASEASSDDAGDELEQEDAGEDLDEGTATDESEQLEETQHLAVATRPLRTTAAPSSTIERPTRRRLAADGVQFEQAVDTKAADMIAAELVIIGYPIGPSMIAKRTSLDVDVVLSTLQADRRFEKNGLGWSLVEQEA
jgi:hypothetical protein